MNGTKKPAMTKRSFVSVSFSSKRVQLVQLGPAKKKVQKFASFELPDGLIKKHMVADKAMLTTLFKTAWKKFGIRERSVGIVVPEFSTFIKYLELPKLTITELSEAVSWQAVDFLPTKLEDMSMDWRITKDTKETVNVLAVAIDKDVLSGYVDAVADAGLFPLVVETPSMALSRVGDIESERLLIYRYFDEVILTISDKDKIVGSSVVTGTASMEIVRTASQMLSHYKDTKVKKIYLGGLGLDANIGTHFKTSLGITPELLVQKVEGFDDAQIQEYLIPLSLQFKEPTEPADETTINLLPQELVDVYKKKRLHVQIWGLLMVVTLIMWSATLAATGTFMYISQQEKILAKESSSQLSVASQTQGARDQIKAINETADRVLKIDTAFSYPQGIFLGIMESIPSGIVVNSYQVDVESGEVFLDCFAPTRTDLLTFKQNLEDRPEFSHIIVPISSFEQENDIDFEISFLYQFDLKAQSTK